MARGRTSSLCIGLAPEERQTLARWQRSTTIAAGLAWRGKMILRLACERPDLLSRSLSQWDCRELARQLIAEGIVEGISASTVRRILAAPQLKPWRHHLELHPKPPRDAAFRAIIANLIDLYTGLLWAAEPICTIHLVCDHVSTHHGKEVSMWFTPHPRVGVHFTPVHGSWMNHVEQMASAGPSLSLVDQIRRQDHGRPTCPGGLTLSSYL